jgi:cytidylate kinase
VAPLKPAEDAVFIDTSGIGIDDVVAKVLDLVPATGP